ncbi:SLC13 family permease [Reyranella sp. CPCC 100927]|uniref:SLC13 family permease n=1 Tax=Reyranella sp. CPCC 100927 TaxID=2599616 RepID=UPI0011B71BB2|nr:SLC13 family permease [Reyranella sp. CPCC 100927]TWT13827.1 SLC13 family permease [Reyranella sp. CPCC 100927]
MADDPPDLFAPAEATRARQRRAPPPAYRDFGWVISAMPVLVLMVALSLATFLPREVEMRARLALFALGAAAILWTFTKLNAAYVALGAALFLSLTGAIEQDDLFEALGADVIWLMIGAFMLGAAVQTSGLAARMIRAVAGREASVGSLVWRLTATLIPLAFLIPSTSGRAAVVLPMFHRIADAAGDARVTRALALLIPAIILVSTISSLVGAGSHLIANELLNEIADRKIGFDQWMLWGLPFGIAASLATGWVISRMFLDADTRRRVVTLDSISHGPLSRDEWRTLAIIVGMVGLWATEGLHPLEIATVAIAGGFLLAAPGIGVISWKAGLKAVSWNLIFFVGAALVLGEALIETGAAKWLIQRMLEASGLASGGSPLVVIAGFALFTLTSHIYLTSHAARTAALIPPLLYLAGALDLEPVAVMFIATVGLDYCLTFPVSSKALLVFQEIDRETWAPADLLRLSAIMLPIHALLMIGFYFLYWRHAGLSL